MNFLSRITKLSIERVAKSAFSSHTSLRSRVRERTVPSCWMRYRRSCISMVVSV